MKQLMLLQHGRTSCVTVLMQTETQHVQFARCVYYLLE